MNLFRWLWQDHREVIYADLSSRQVLRYLRGIRYRGGERWKRS